MDTTNSSSNAILTVRVIKSFSYRTVKNAIIRDVDLEQLTVRGLKDLVTKTVETQPGWKAYRNIKPDCLKIYSQPQHTKTMNLIINLENDDNLIFNDDERSLASCGCSHETELSFFNSDDYMAYKEHPEQLW